MAGTVNVPGIGPLSKRAVGLSAAGIGAIGIIWYIRSKRASSATAAAPAAATTAGQQTDPAGNTGVIDPTTGYVYGSPEDQQLLAQLQGTGAPYDTTGLGGALSGYYYGPGTSTSSNPPGPGNFADNAEWAQYAEQYMISTLNADANATGNALGKYITGQPVDATQQGIIEEAIAIAGFPPQSGPGGDPPGINLQSGSGGGGSGGGGGGGGSGGGTKPPAAAPGGFSVTGHTGYADFGCDAIAGATSYDWDIISVKTVTTKGNHLEHQALKAGTYHARVRAKNSAGAGPWTASKTFRVK